MNNAQEKEFEELVKEHELLIRKVCRVYAREWQDKQDLFQEIVIQLWKSYPTFKGQSRISTWMYKVAIYTAISGLRKQKNLIRYAEPGTLPQSASDVQYDDTKDKQLEYLYKAIAQLNEIEKAIVMLYLEDKSYADMEEILGIGEGNLRVKMSRIKDKLRQIVKS
ncbi:MAG TPA: sigma-70 family RNA polymerase sigma factor [Candidatus Babeliaceae bacterium]|nr:sigma-70 family RNA polymerase sigma factor [Candidatus Babeliaceae bacterium]